MNYFSTLSIRTIATIFAGAGEGLFIPAMKLEGAFSEFSHISNFYLNRALHNAHPELFKISDEQIFQCWHSLPHCEIIKEMKLSTKSVDIVGFGYDLVNMVPITNGIIHSSIGEREMLIEIPARGLPTISANSPCITNKSPIRVRTGNRIGDLYHGVIRIMDLATGNVKFAAVNNGVICIISAQYKRALRGVE